MTNNLMCFKRKLKFNLNTETFSKYQRCHVFETTLLKKHTLVKSCCMFITKVSVVMLGDTLQYNAATIM